ncbi:MAG TPA: hypothetical protein VHA52_03460, partial [Candidatus Babeliaceae bacterium]|nr:hypothetical protein [Candidatus Babeliaceae bacterium]
GFADVWAKAFLKHSYHLESTVAASLPSLIFIGMCFGAPVLSFVAEKVGNYLITIIGAGIAMAAGFSLLLFFPMTFSLLSLIFIIVGVCCAYQILAIYKASTYVREEVAGLTTAVSNMIIMIFGYGFHTVIGGVVNIFGGTTASRALNLGVAVIPIALCLGTAGYALLFMKERNTLKKGVEV